MPQVYSAALRSWSVPPAATLALLLTAIIYLRGWWLLRAAGFPRLPAWRAASFLLGLLWLWIALASPLDTFSGFLLTAHMLQHMVLMMVAPPLILLGEPLIPMVRGLPRFAAREFAGPLLNWRPMQTLGRRLTHPITALLLMGVAMFAWHVPRLYELALQSSGWHEVEHACFFTTSLLFWWPVVQPWPSHRQWPRWAMVPYLLIADLQNTVLSAILVFSDRILYPSYGRVPRLFGLTPLEDQVASGAVMWLFGSLVFIVPAVLIVVQSLGRRSAARPAELHAELPAMGFARNAVLPDEALPGSSLSVPRRSHPVSDMRLWALRHLGYPRLASRTIEAILFVIVFVLVAAGFAVTLAPSSDSDDQVIRVQQRSGPFLLTVLTPADDLPLGSSEIDVLVQDAATLEPVLDSPVRLRARSVSDAAQPVAIVAEQSSENRLLQSATIDFPSQGSWTVDVEVGRGTQQAQVSLPLHVARTASGLGDSWPRLLFPLGGAALLCIYLYRHRASRSRVVPQPLSPA